MAYDQFMYSQHLLHYEAFSKRSLSNLIGIGLGRLSSLLNHLGSLTPKFNTGFPITVNF